MTDIAAGAGADPATMTRDEALNWAERARAVRHVVIDRLRSGDRSLDDVLDTAAVDPLVAMIRVLPVAEALPGWGKVTARRALDAAQIGHDTPLSGCDRAALVAALAHPDS